MNMIIKQIKIYKINNIIKIYITFSSAQLIRHGTSRPDNANSANLGNIPINNAPVKPTQPIRKPIGMNKIIKTNTILLSQLPAWYNLY